MRYLFLTILFLMCFWVSGQNCAIYSERNVSLYPSLPNPIKINVDGKSNCSGYYVSVDNGKIEVHDCNYSIIPEKIGEATVSVFKNNGKLIDKKVFRVEELILEAYIVGTIPSQSNYIKDVKALSKAPGLGTMHKDLTCWDWDNKSLNYEVLITKSNDQIIRFKSQTSNFSEAMRNQFELLQSGDILLFHSITLNEKPVKDLIFKIQ